MMARAHKSNSIKNTLDYNENKKKNGKILLSHGIATDMPKDVQIALLEKVHNPKFKVKAHTIVISHTEQDSKEIKTEAQEKKILVSFLKEMERRGVNLDSAPWLIVRHTNTKHLHYHMAIMNTCFDGSRFDDSFLGARACRAAATVSIQMDLGAAEKAVQSVKAARKKFPPKKKKIREVDELKEKIEKVITANNKHISRRASLFAKYNRENAKSENIQTDKVKGKPQEEQGIFQRIQRGTEEPQRKGRRM